MKIKHFLMALSVSFFLPVNLCYGDYKCSFAEGGWNPDDWLIVKSPRWEYIGSWNQEKDHIANKVASDITLNDMLVKRAGETYTSMILKEKFSGSTEISSTICFTHMMAPLIVITDAYGKSSAGTPEHREHYEIVLCDKGINVWHHYFKDGKPSWHKAAFIKTEFKANEKYLLSVKMDFSEKGPAMIISADGKTFGFFDESLPRSFHAGITACEGINKFYDFSVKKIK